LNALRPRALEPSAVPPAEKGVRPEIGVRARFFLRNPGHIGRRPKGRYTEVSRQKTGSDPDFLTPISPLVPSERDIVVEILDRRAGGRGRRLLGPRRRPGAGTAAEHLHVVGDDLRRPAVVTVTILPLARPQAPFDVHLRALAQVLGSDLGQ